MDWANSIVGPDAIVNVNHIKKARYCLHVSMCASFIKLKDAHYSSGLVLTVYDWLMKVSAKESAMGCYWAIVIELSAMIQIYAAIPVDTFADFAKMLYEKIIKISHRYKRCDVVCDRYLADSVKNEIIYLQYSWTSTVITRCI